MTINQPPGEHRGLAAFDQTSSALDRGLDQLAIAFHTLSASIYAARCGELELSRLADAIATGKHQLAVARSMLRFEDHEQDIAKHLETEDWFAGWIIEKLQEPSTDAKVLARIEDDFLEHETVGRMAIASGLHGTWLIRQIAGNMAGGSRSGAAANTQLQEAGYLVKHGGCVLDHATSRTSFRRPAA